MIPCKHLEAASEAWTDDGQRIETLPLCTWACERQKKMPPWAYRLAGGGLPIDPDRDCQNCPAHEPYDFTAAMKQARQGDRT